MLRIHELLKVIDMGDGNFNYQQTIAMLTYKYIKLSEQRGRASLNIAMFGVDVFTCAVQGANLYCGLNSID